MSSKPVPIVCAHCRNLLTLQGLGFFEGRFFDHVCTSCSKHIARDADRWRCQRGCDFEVCTTCANEKEWAGLKADKKLPRPPCEGCGDAIPEGVRWHANLCEACYHLGRGLGGSKPTAINAAEDLEVIRHARSFHVKPSATAPAVSPRVAAAENEFQLHEDAVAQAYWLSFSQRDIDTGSLSGDEMTLLKAAQSAAEHLRFLKLTVQSQEVLREQQLSQAKIACLELYSIYTRIPLEKKEALVEAARKVLPASRCVGALVGMAVADALGAPFEFIDAVDEPGKTGSMFELATFKRYGVRNKFQVRHGQWTDDSSMGLCLADSLLARGRYDGSDVRVRFHNWWFRGYNNAFGNDTRIGSIGLGGNVSKSLAAMRPGEDPDPCYFSATQDAGNGSLMRLASVPVFFSRDASAAARISAASSEATHPGKIAAAACAFYGFAVAKAVEREAEATDPQAFLDDVVAQFFELRLPGAEDCPEVVRLLNSAEPPGKEENWNWRSPHLKVEDSLRARGVEYNGYPCFANYFGSFCIDGLAVALWSFYHTTNFIEAIVRCVNFLGDADTTAAICGQLAGAFYGYDGIDRKLINALEVWDDKDVSVRGALLYSQRDLVDIGAAVRDVAEAAVCSDLLRGAGSEAEHVKQIFKSWDVNASGRISREELAHVLQRLCPSFTEADMEKLFQAMDSNRDGGIDYDEFISWICR